MDVLISTVGTSLIDILMRQQDGFAALDDDVVTRYLYDVVASSELEARLIDMATYLRKHPELVWQTDELTTVRKYVHRMTGNAHIILPKTDYILLATNTVIGHFCAEQLKSVVCAHMADAYVSIVYIDDLHTHTVDTLHTAWAHMRDALDQVNRRYKSDVIYNVTGDYSLFAGFIHAYATHQGARIIYAHHPSAPLIIIDADPSGTPADMTFYYADVLSHN